MVIDIIKNQPLLEEFSDFQIYRYVECTNCNMTYPIISETVYTLSKNKYIKHIFLKIPTQNIEDIVSVWSIDIVVIFNCIKCNTLLSCKRQYFLDLNKKERLKILLTLLQKEGLIYV